MTHEELVAVIIAKVVQAVPDYPEGPIRTVEEIAYRAVAIGTVILRLHIEIIYSKDEAQGESEYSDLAGWLAAEDVDRRLSAT